MIYSTTLVNYVVYELKVDRNFSYICSRTAVIRVMKFSYAQAQ